MMEYPKNSWQSFKEDFNKTFNTWNEVTLGILVLFGLIAPWLFIIYGIVGFIILSSDKK